MRKLIPDYWTLPARTREDLVFLGSINLEQMHRHWESSSKGCVTSVKDLQKMIDFLDGKTAEKIIKAAKRFENPDFPRIGRVDHHDADEPLDDASINRKSGATTFNVCGWCKYASGGTCRYSYNIQSACEFERNAGLKSEYRKFNTQCFLQTAPQSKFTSIRNGLIRQRSKVVKRKAEYDRRVLVISTMLVEAVKKPAVQRPMEWFNVNDEVVCYLDALEGRIETTKFAVAKVISGYRHHDGFVSVSSDKKLHTGSNLGGFGLGYGESRPEVMHRWEFDYMKVNPDFAKVWAKCFRDMKLFDPKKFVKDLSRSTL